MKCKKCSKREAVNTRINKSTLVRLCAECTKTWDMAMVLTSFKIKRSYRDALIEKFGSLQTGLTEIIESFLKRY